MNYPLILSLFIITTILLTLILYKTNEERLTDFEKVIAGLYISFGRCLAGSLLVNLFVYASIVATMSY